MFSAPQGVMKNDNILGQTFSYNIFLIHYRMIPGRNLKVTLSGFINDLGRIIEKIEVVVFCVGFVIFYFIRTDNSKTSVFRESFGLISVGNGHIYHTHREHVFLSREDFRS